MIALSIARFDKISDKEQIEMDLNRGWKNYEAHDHPKFIDRRVGFDVHFFP